MSLQRQPPLSVLMYARGRSREVRKIKNKHKKNSFLHIARPPGRPLCSQVGLASASTCVGEPALVDSCHAVPRTRSPKVMQNCRLAGRGALKLRSISWTSESDWSGPGNLFPVQVHAWKIKLRIFFLKGSARAVLA